MKTTETNSSKRKAAREEMSEEQSTWLQNINTTSQELQHKEPPELCYGDGSQRPASQGDANKIAIQENNAASTGAWVDEEDPDPQQTREAIYQATSMGEDNTNKTEPLTQRWIDNPNIARLSAATIIVIASVILVTRLLILNKPESPAIPSISASASTSVRASRRVSAITTSSVSVPVNPRVEPPCDIDFDIQIVPPPGGFPNCPSPLSTEPCEGSLTEIVMLYTGGPCSQSYNDQDSQFSCTDYGHGPPTKIGEESYILVTDLSGERIFYSDRVQVMNTFTFNGINSQSDTHQLITIYNSPELKPENMVQSIQYDSSCSANVLLLDRFGAVQVLEWVTDEEGRSPSPFSTYPVFNVKVAIDITGGPATIQNFAILKGDVDLVTEPEFFHMDLMTGSDVPTQTSIEFPMDYFYSRRLTYYLLIDLIATTRSGKSCKLLRVHDFTEGCQLPNLFPIQTQTQTIVTAPPTMH